MFKRYWWIFLAMIPLGVLAGFLIAAIATYVTPTEYESMALIEIADRRPRLTHGEMREPRTEAFFQTEVQRITSQKSLEGALGKLDLKGRSSLDAEEGLSAIRSATRVERLAGSEMISVRVRHTNREFARDMATEVVRAYSAYRDDLGKLPLQAKLGELDDVLREQEDTVAEKRRIVGLLTEREERQPGEGRGLVDAIRDLETEISLLHGIKLKMVEIEVEKNAEAVGTVVVHDNPVIPDTPVSPNVTRNLLTGSVGGLLFSPFLALPLIWMLGRKQAG